MVLLGFFARVQARAQEQGPGPATYQQVACYGISPWCMAHPVTFGFRIAQNAVTIEQQSVNVEAGVTASGMHPV